MDTDEIPVEAGPVPAALCCEEVLAEAALRRALRASTENTWQRTLARLVLLRLAGHGGHRTNATAQADRRDLIAAARQVMQLLGAAATPEPAILTSPLRLHSLGVWPSEPEILTRQAYAA